MTLARTRLFVALVGLACLIAAGLSLMRIGGPGATRQLRRDETRLDALYEIAFALRCQAEDGGPPARALNEIPPACLAAERVAMLVDPLTRADYRIDRPSPQRLRVCATFETAGRLPAQDSAGVTFEPESGCVVAGLRP